MFSRRFLPIVFKDSVKTPAGKYANWQFNKVKGGVGNIIENI